MLFEVVVVEALPSAILVPLQTSKVMQVDAYWRWRFQRPGFFERVPSIKPYLRCPKVDSGEQQEPVAWLEEGQIWIAFS